jgi:UPF0716 family protein affecting phage T7 exclusion
MKALGCLGILALLTWLALESLLYIQTARFLNERFGSVIGTGGWWLPMLWIIAAVPLGASMAKRHASQVMLGLLNGTAGRHVVGVIGGVLIALPGLASEIPGLLLLVPPIQKGLGALGNKIVASIVKRTMGGMMGGFGGKAAPGGFPFPFGAAGKGNPFPGMTPRADEAIPFRKGGKTYDTVAEKD